MTDPLLEIRDLRITFRTHNSTVKAVRGVSLNVMPGEVIGIVGESGCGKSATAHAMLGLISRPCSQGSVIFEGEDLLKKTDREMRSIRGNKIGIVFQDPMTSLNPTMRIGKQLEEVIRCHRSMTHEEAKKVVIQMLEAVGISQPESRLDQYPHQFSGGMRQRVMIAMALICNPSLLIADEPTTSLDVTIQAQILELLKKLKADRGMSILLITHDLGVVAGICDRIVVMYAGEVMEIGSVEQIFYSPQHPYTKALLSTVPRLGTSHRQRLTPIQGSPPNLMNPPAGCPFAPRCQWAMELCRRNTPPLSDVSEGHSAACWLHHKQAHDRLAAFLEHSRVPEESKG